MEHARNYGGNSLEGRKPQGCGRKLEGKAAAGTPGGLVAGDKSGVVYQVEGSTVDQQVAGVRAVMGVSLQGRRIVMGCEGGGWVPRRVSGGGWGLQGDTLPGAGE